MSPNSSEKPVNPNEHLHIPKWVNEDYFLPIIQEDVDNFDKIVNFVPIAATAPGENYTSIMIRVIVDILLKDGSEQKVSYILKTMLEADSGADVVNNMGLFPKERKMYEVHIPQFVKLYKGAGLEIELAPKCLHVEATAELITLVFEDLSRQKFQNFDRLKGFDLPHMRQVLRKLAELHAASAVAKEINGPYDPMYFMSMYNEQSRYMIEAVGKLRQEQFIKAMHNWELENVESYVARLWSPMEVFEVGLHINQVDENEFNVLNHGDCWSNNIMFNYKDNGEIDRTLFVDLQIGKWGSPAQDLWYLITTSASLDIKVKEFDHFIYIYHQRLAECLKLLNYSKPIPTLRDLHVMMLKYGYWGPLTALGVMVATLMPTDKDSNIKMMMSPGPEGDALRYRTFSNPYYVKAMKQLLPFFDNKGLLKSN
ncbi:uncharacterized protein LOC122619240 isoform X1 [Drosophila teissieri]|uniref:uncharacterized protein LOC122619240 isoform X1 n=2 Tax=Drosophila teissieri TaxID=7243 RepID=UPI001CB9DC25|nr:uncharacterized protein LOC122619240 isoform X1 [Drosophila teissieri]XP_043651973.1 uncharacterized protein LOC122619240 isoform X1 [Drosophila teissieri]